jgi:probable rRNA maturation factor
MKLFLDNDTDVTMDFDFNDVAVSVIEKTLNTLNCPFDVAVNMVLTDNETIHECNREMRGIDKATDVLSFPYLTFDEPGVYELEGSEADYIDPETGLIVLGDIMISLDKVKEQAEEYGHSLKREYAFLIAHSMLHLSGYDHMTDEDAAHMEQMQESILKSLGIDRD